MESPSFVQTLRNKDWRFKTATTLGDVLCLAVLKARSDIENYNVETVTEAREQWVIFGGGNCEGTCPHYKFCLAASIKE